MTRTTTHQQQQSQQQQQQQQALGATAASSSRQQLSSSQQLQSTGEDDKVVLTGSSLQTARVNEHAEFTIDGTNAGAGKLCLAPRADKYERYYGPGSECTQQL